jgi:hypothetical protein
MRKLSVRRLLPGLFFTGVAALVWGAPAAAQTRVVCESRDNQPNFCAVDTRGGVQLSRQLSSARCREGESWGYDRRGIWVDRGCRAEFTIRSGWSSGRAEIITCSSEEHRRQFCPADTRGGVRLLRRFSDADCRQGTSWGYDHSGIWVDRGCRAEFEVASGGWRGGWGDRRPDRGGETLSILCESRDRRRQVCPADIRGTVRLVRRLSDADCRQGSTWGYDHRSIWVDRGCRAEFEIQSTGGRGDRRDFPGRRGGQLTGAFRACANEVAARFRGVSANQVEMEEATQGGVGTQLIEWYAPNGASGYCRVNRNGQVVQFKQD